MYLVEGYTDVISMHASGVENVVASSGTALTKGQIKLIASQTQNITVVYDGDTAGVKASMRGIDLLLESGLNVHVVPLPEGEDPDSFARKLEDDHLKKYLEENSISFLLFKAKVLSKEAGNDPMKRANMVNEIINNIAEIPEIIARSMFIKECAQLFDLPEDTLNVQLRKAVWKKMNLAKNGPNPSASDVNIIDTPVSLPDTSYASQTAQIHVNHVEINEENIIYLILKYGMYEIDVEINIEDEVLFDKTRIDQYLFDEFHDQNIKFTNPLFQTIYEEYALIATVADTQEKIISYFSSHEDSEINNFVTRYFVKEDPEYSDLWETKFDIMTRGTKNNVHKLNAIVENTINMFKLRLIERYQQLVIKELDLENEEELVSAILDKLNKINKRREELCKLLGTVITK